MHYSMRGLATAAIAVILGACASAPVNCPPAQPPVERVRYEHARWQDLPGWSTDEVKESWPAFMKSCGAVGSRPEWSVVCAAARAVNPTTSAAARAFFESNFEPYGVIKETGANRQSTGLITGYYEPLLRGARQRSAQFSAPLYAPPDDLLTVDLASVYPELKGKRVRARLQGNKVIPYYSRADLDNGVSLQGKEIVWVESAIDAFVLQIQGSGRVQLARGETIRLQYADQNGHPYQSIGRYLVDRGELPLEQAGIAAIRQWLALHPERLHEVLNANPSVVFFREERLEDPAPGPKGALGVPLTPGRSIAVDPASVPLGAPVFMATTYPASAAPLQRLMNAQDTGGAIRGAVRADFFWGVGTEAGDQAGKMRQQGSLWVLWPKGAQLLNP